MTGPARSPCGFWSDPTEEHTVDYREVCGPLYTQSPGNALDQIETIRNADVLAHWLAGEGVSFDLRAGLAKAACPVLVLAGELDPVSPISGAEEMVEALPADRVRFERFPECGHGVFRDDPVASTRILRDFITE